MRDAAAPRPCLAGRASPVLRRSASSPSIDRHAGVVHGLAPFGDLGALELGECRRPSRLGVCTPSGSSRRSRKAVARTMRSISALSLAAMARPAARPARRRAHHAVVSKPVIAGLGDASAPPAARRSAGLAADRERTQLAALHVRQHRLQRIEHDLDLAADQVGDRRCAALVGHVLESMPAAALNISPVRWPGVPLPAEP